MVLKIEEESVRFRRIRELMGKVRDLDLEAKQTQSSQIERLMALQQELISLTTDEPKEQEIVQPEPLDEADAQTMIDAVSANPKNSPN